MLSAYYHNHVESFEATLLYADFQENASSMIVQVLTRRCLSEILVLCLDGDTLQDRIRTQKLASKHIDFCLVPTRLLS